MAHEGGISMSPVFLVGWLKWKIKMQTWCEMKLLNTLSEMSSLTSSCTLAVHKVPFFFLLTSGPITLGERAISKAWTGRMQAGIEKEGRAFHSQLQQRPSSLSKSHVVSKLLLFPRKERTTLTDQTGCESRGHGFYFKSFWSSVPLLWSLLLSLLACGDHPRKEQPPKSTQTSKLDLRHTILNLRNPQFIFAALIFVLPLIPFSNSQSCFRTQPYIFRG